MWCGHCEAEVAGIVSSGDDRRLICARCQHPVEDLAADSLSDPLENLPSGPPGLRLDMSHLRENLQAVDRLLESLTLMAPPSDPLPNPEVRSQIHVRQIKRKPPRVLEEDDQDESSPSPAPDVDQKSQLSSPSWLIGGVLGTGTVVLCGGALLSMASLIRDLPLAWNLGLPSLLLGQAGVIIGLVLYADSLATREEELTEQLSELRQAKPGLRKSGLSLLSSRRASRHASRRVKQDT